MCKKLLEAIKKDDYELADDLYSKKKTVLLDKLQEIFTYGGLYDTNSSRPDTEYKELLYPNRDPKKATFGIVIKILKYLDTKFPDESIFAEFLKVYNHVERVHPRVFGDIAFYFRKYINNPFIVDNPKYNQEELKQVAYTGAVMIQCVIQVLKLYEIIKKEDRYSEEILFNQNFHIRRIYLEIMVRSRPPHIAEHYMLTALLDEKLEMEKVVRAELFRLTQDESEVEARVNQMKARINVGNLKAEIPRILGKAYTD